MKIKTKMTFTYIEDKYAEIAYNSLYPDNDGFIESHVEDNKLICYIENEKITSVLNTIEDLIHCEKMIEMTSTIV
ncbi:KEOPS complex subunit Pcc1 [Methanosphaera sp.]